MCHLIRTRYTCTHLAPFHPPNYKRPTTKEDAKQANPKTEWPTHPDTTLQNCQDACRRGARCSGQLEELHVVEKMGPGICQACEDAHEESEGF